MENIIFTFPPVKIARINEMSELLCLTRGQYLGKLFGWGEWVLEESQAGKQILSSYEHDTTQCRILTSPKLDELRESWKIAHLLAKR